MTLTFGKTYEELQLKLIGEYLHINDIESYCKMSLKDTKTVDGFSKSTNTIFNCKYIKENGGSQDNQFNDLIKFNQPSDFTYNYLVISGKYGITKMEKYTEAQDLYQITILQIIEEDLSGGILVLPINFIIGTNGKTTRKVFG